MNEARQNSSDDMVEKKKSIVTLEMGIIIHDKNVIGEKRKTTIVNNGKRNIALAIWIKMKFISYKICILCGHIISIHFFLLPLGKTVCMVTRIGCNTHASANFYTRKKSSYVLLRNKTMTEQKKKKITKIMSTLKTEGSHCQQSWTFFPLLAFNWNKFVNGKAFSPAPSQTSTHTHTHID